MSSSECHEMWNSWLDCNQNLTTEIYVVVFWVKTLYYEASGYRSFGTVRCIHLRGRKVRCAVSPSILKTDTVNSSESSVRIYQGTWGSHAIIFGVTATGNWNTTSESPPRGTQFLLQSHCNEKLKSYFRVTATRNSNPTSESLQWETQILLQIHRHEKRKSYFRVTATRN